MIELYVQVVTVINGWAVPTLGGQNATWEATQRMDPSKPVEGKRPPKNLFEGINQQGRASVKVGLEEKLSGPAGTYSSVSVRVEISARCDQDSASIRAARDALAKEGMKALEWYAAPALELLMRHVQVKEGPRGK